MKAKLTDKLGAAPAGLDTAADHLAKAPSDKSASDGKAANDSGDGASGDTAK